MNTDRVKKIDEISLKRSSHKSIEDGACVMELVSYVAGEAWSDRPQCTCPSLTSFAIGLNDRADDATRQLLKPFVLKLIGTRGSVALTKKRGEYLSLQSINVSLPILTDALELTDVSARLRSFTSKDFRAAREYIYSVQEVIREAARKHVSAYAYAYAYAADAAAYAAYAAADAGAFAAADAASAAYAAADAASAAYAAADAASAAYDAASAAKGGTGSDKWRLVKEQVWTAAINALAGAIELKEDAA